jgi:hypothetical protein
MAAKSETFAEQSRFFLEKFGERMDENNKKKLE